MRVGMILDRSIELLPKIINRTLLLFILLIAVFQTGLQFLYTETQGETLLLYYPLALIRWVIVSYLHIVFVFLARDAWLAEGISFQSAHKRTSFVLILKLFFLEVMIVLVAGLWAILLLIPGIIYAVNRILAPQAMILENLTMRAALRRSKRLMTAEPFYALRGPFARASGLTTITIIVALLPTMIVASITNVDATTSAGVAFTGVNAVLLYVSNSVTFICTCFTTTALVGLYFDLRARHEGYDLERRLEKFQALEANS